MIIRSFLLPLTLISCLVRLGSSWSDDVVCFNSGGRDLVPLTALHCHVLVGRILTLPYLRTAFTWSPYSSGPPRLPAYFQNGNCQLWLVENQQVFHHGFEKFSLFETIRNVTRIMLHCFKDRPRDGDGPWGGYIDVGDFDRVRLSLVNHQHPPRPPEDWPPPSRPHSPPERSLSSKNSSNLDAVVAEKKFP